MGILNRRYAHFNFKLIRFDCVHFDGTKCKNCQNEFDGLCSEEACELTIKDIEMANMKRKWKRGEIP